MFSTPDWLTVCKYSLKFFIINVQSMAKIMLQLITLNYRETIPSTDLSNKQLMYLSMKQHFRSDNHPIQKQSMIYWPNWSYTKTQREKIDWNWYWNGKNTPYKKTSVEILKYTTVLSPENNLLFVAQGPQALKFLGHLQLFRITHNLCCQKCFSILGFFAMSNKLLP